MGTTRVFANLREFIKFGMVGGSGTIVNFFVVWVLNRFVGIDED